MRFPVGVTGIKEEFERDWYSAQGFGAQTTYGYHDGDDINKRTGGDTDLNQELKAISKGRIVYYHVGHPDKNFGRHLVYKIDGDWGSRWVHYAHCSDLDFNPTVKDVNEGEIIARIGKSGTTYAHLHWAIFKVDPIAFGIDNIPNTQTELHQYWEDPIAFVEKWLQPVVIQPLINDQTLIPIGGTWGTIELQAVRSRIFELEHNYQDTKDKLQKIKEFVANA